MNVEAWRWGWLVRSKKNAEREVLGVPFRFSHILEEMVFPKLPIAHAKVQRTKAASRTPR